MQKSCRQCSAPFEITSDDLAFYDKVSPVFNGKKEVIPPPTICPDCRMQRRLVWRNERSLYHRKCDLTGKQIISIYSPDKAVPVYSGEAWWGDQWDPLSHGRDVDFSLPFFKQFRDLQRAVPQIALFSRENENSDYTNHVYQMKNCYLVSTAVSCQDCYYGDWVIRSKNCVDCSHVTGCERCYETSDSADCHDSAYLLECDRCSDSRFLFDCRDCHHCLFCWNLRHKEYHIRNVPVSKEEFEEAAATLRSRSTVQAAAAAFRDMLVRNAVHPFRRATQTEESSGDHLIECRNAMHCYDVHRAQDVRYVSDAIDIADSADCNYTAFHCALNYEDHACDGSQNVCFSTRCYDNHDILYCDLCHDSSHLFGCIGLRHKTYCILNKQYTKEEYEALAPRLIEHMKKNNEWGEFFNVAVSPFGYNETVAHEYFPLSKEEVIERGWKWHEEEENSEKYLGPAVSVADDIATVPDDIANQILICEKSKKPYKIIPQELRFYRDMGLPVPRESPAQRHKERMALRNPRKLWNRNCAKCSRAIETTYASDRPEIVYCEACYLATLY